MPPIAQWTTPQIGPLGGKQPPTQARIKAIPMPEMATGTPWFPVMAQSMSGQTALTLTGGGGQGQSLPPAIGSSSHGGRARNGKASHRKARDGKIGIGNHASNGTTNAQVVPQAHGEDGQPHAAPPNPDRHLYRGVGADKRRKERSELQRQGKEVPPELQPLKISLNKALKRQMHELHTKAREMAQEEDTEKLKKWEEEQSIWLEIVAREEAEKKAASSTKSEDDSKEGDGPKPEEGSRNMPDDGTGDKAPDNMDIGNRARSRSLSSGIKSPRRFYSSRARPEMGRGVRLAHGLPIREMEEEEEAEDNKPEERSRKKKKKRRSKSHKPEMAPVKEEPDPDGPPGPDGGGGAAAAAVT